MAFPCCSCEDDVVEDVQMIICLSALTPSIIGHRVDYAVQEGGECARE